MTSDLTRRRTLQYMAATGSAMALGPSVGWAKPKIQRQLWVTNAYGDDVHVFEVGSWKLLKHFTVGPNPHGISATADGRTVHISTEDFKKGVGELIWIDSASAKVIDRIPLGIRPNAHECTHDGKWIYVPCRAEGYWWVVDGHERRIVTKVHTGGGPHNTLVSPDGESRMYLSPQGDPSKIFIVDIKAGHKIIGEIPFGDVPRPSAISTDEKYFFQNINGLLGFEAADIKSRKVIARVRHRPMTNPYDNDERSHGICARPGGKELWSSIMADRMVYVNAIGNDSFPELARIEMPATVYWIRFDPDGRYAYISCPPDEVVVVDCWTRKIVTVLKCGKKPKRTKVIDVPVF